MKGLGNEGGWRGWGMKGMGICIRLEVTLGLERLKPSRFTDMISSYFILFATVCNYLDKISSTITMEIRFPCSDKTRGIILSTLLNEHITPGSHTNSNTILRKLLIMR